MDIELQTALKKAIEGFDTNKKVLSSIDLKKTGGGTIEYNPEGVWVDPKAPGFSGTRTNITDEELVRAYLISKLTFFYGYPANKKIIEIERSYRPVGRPVGKGGRVDIIVRKREKNGKKSVAFLFIECKSPDKYDEDMKLIDGQLFRLSLQEQPRPKYLIYFTSDFRSGELRDRVILIDTDSFSSYDLWDDAGQPITDIIPTRYGRPKLRRYANVEQESKTKKPLDRSANPEVFNRLRLEIHDVIWGGGGTNNNDVFIYIVKLFLCKIFDEKETLPGNSYEFQRLGDEIEPESPLSLTERMNAIYAKAEDAYLALPIASTGPAFDPTRLSPEKLAYVIGRLEALSLTENIHPGDLLGEFFEQIVSQDFTQTKGQFFTPIKLVRFMLHLAQSSEFALKILKSERDHLGRPRLPYVIDPACGSGSFLIEYMKLITDRIGAPEVAKSLPQRIRESFHAWFRSGNSNLWAREYIFGIENNYDLGLAAKVNMVLHGDGSMNTWLASGLLPFPDYWVDGRTNILGSEKDGFESLYSAKVNEQFDQIFSNPPFSLKLSPDEKKKIRESFAETVASISEKKFIERWYQLLRPGGCFCCVLPETILDTSSNAKIRLFLIQHFRIDAVISLPYDAFRPFTSTKTCVVFATKRDTKETIKWKNTWELCGKNLKNAGQQDIFQEVIKKLGWDEEPIFMAEPEYIGYKRRKNLPDLYLPNQLYIENEDGNVDKSSYDSEECILGRFRNKSKSNPSLKLGFWTNLKNAGKRDAIRLDPKYRWFWDFQGGVGHGNAKKAVPLGDVLQIYPLEKVPKGDLGEELTLIDLEFVESRQAFVRDDTPIVDTIGSEKVRFKGSDLVISKLEPYLGKIIINPPDDSIGSTEWVGLIVKTQIPIPIEVLSYFLMLPDMCESYRRLQSGKRHARFNPEEFLDIKVELPEEIDFEDLKTLITMKRQEIINLRKQEDTEREAIDKLFL